MITIHGMSGRITIHFIEMYALFGYFYSIFMEQMISSLSAILKKIFMSDLSLLTHNNIFCICRTGPYKITFSKVVTAILDYHLGEQTWYSISAVPATADMLPSALRMPWVMSFSV